MIPAPVLALLLLEVTASDLRIDVDSDGTFRLRRSADHSRELAAGESEPELTAGESDAAGSDGRGTYMKIKCKIK